MQPSPMVNYIDLWATWRRGKVESFHKYQVYNGDKYIECERQSLQMPKTVCETWANMLFNERCSISVDGEDITRDAELTNSTAQFIKDVFDKNNLWSRLNEAQELKFAYGTIAYIPRIKGVKYGENKNIIGGGTPLIDIVTADKLIPLTHDNGIVDELAVCSYKTIKGVKYAYIQMFVKESHGYVIKNIMIKLGDSHYQPIEDITVLSGYEQKANIFPTQSDVKPFVIDRPNITNNIEQDSPYGISVYANALDSVKACDLGFDGLTLELMHGRTKVFVSPQMMFNEKGRPFFDPRDVVYQFMPQIDGSTSVSSLMQVVQPQLRIDDFEKAIQTSLNIFSSQCGLGENYYRFGGNYGITTATQVLSEQSAAYRTKSKHEIILESVLYDLIILMVDIGIKTLNMKSLNPTPEIKIRFDDSIIEDKTSEKKQTLLEISQGVMKSWEYRVKYFGETEEQAKTALGIDDSEFETETNAATQEFREIATPNAGRLEGKLTRAIPQ